MKYHEEQNKEMLLKLRELEKDLPTFCIDFFDGIEQTTLIRTRLSYARDLMIFFKYLKEYVEHFVSMDIISLQTKDMEYVKATDIERFLSTMTLYETANKEGELIERQNGEKGKARKLAAVRSLFKYLYKHEMIQADPASLVSTPKIHEKNIIRLNYEEINDLLTEVDNGDQLTKGQKRFHESTKLRDIAIITTLLGTGMRISELVGLDLKDVDSKAHSLKIIRKGGNEAIIFYGDEVHKALDAYISEREKISPLPGNENALFLSIQKKRMCVKTMENLVDKYAKVVVPLKHISPHKLRSSYGTALYNETGDIYLVASVLGHKDVNTTRKHYAALDEDRKKEAANVVRLRSSEENNPSNNNT